MKLVCNYYNIQVLINMGVMAQLTNLLPDILSLFFELVAQWISVQQQIDEWQSFQRIHLCYISYLQQLDLK